MSGARAEMNATSASNYVWKAATAFANSSAAESSSTPMRSPSVTLLYDKTSLAPRNARGRQAPVATTTRTGNAKLSVLLPKLPTKHPKPHREMTWTAAADTVLLTLDRELARVGATRGSRESGWHWHQKYCPTFSAPAVEPPYQTPCSPPSFGTFVCSTLQVRHTADTSTINARPRDLRQRMRTT